MKRAWMVARHEFISNITKPSFLAAIFGIPLMFLVIMVVVSLVTAATSGAGDFQGERVGYVDQAGVLVADLMPSEWTAFETREAAQSALDAQTIESYFWLAEDYWRTGVIGVYAYGTLAESAQDRFEALVSDSLRQQVSQQPYAERLSDPVNMTVYVEDMQRSLTSQNIFGLFILPIAFMMLFIIALQMTSQFLMSGVVEEKTNRIMEILTTSVRPMELLAGKVLGLGAIGLLQVAVWLLVLAGVIVLGRSNETLAAVLDAVSLPLDLVFFAFVYFLLTYFLYASILAGFGALVESEQESRSYAGILSMPLVVPLFFLVTFLNDPNGSLPTLLSFIPFTSGISMLFRLSFTAVPLWQLGISLVLLVLTSLVMVWIGARLFRWGALLTGKSPSPREIWRVIRGAQEA